MRYSASFLLLVVSGIFFSCGGQEVKKNDVILKQINEQTGIIIPNYTMVNMESSSAIGDYSESFIIKFDSSEFQILVDRILKAKNYSEEIIPTTEHNVNEPPTSRWQKYESGYKYEIYLPENNVHIYYYVNTTKQILGYMFIEE